jgi:hypothetical protein
VSPSDELTVRRLLHKQVRVGRYRDIGPIYTLAGYNATTRQFTVKHESGRESHVSAKKLLDGKRDKIVHVLS